MQGKNNGEEESKVKRSKEENRGHSCSLSLHFWSTSRSPFSTFYIPFQSSESQESNASNRVRFGAEMRKIWPSEDNCSRGVRNFLTTPSKFAHPLACFSKYGCYVMAWMHSHGNFSHPEVISYELLEGEVFNSKFCINPLEPISMAIERFETIRMEDHENFREFHAKLMDIMNSSFNLGSLQTFEMTLGLPRKSKGIALNAIKEES
ncbi:hypothetical protein CK203_057746 [Vitis vinifera]|uniref:Uncharacterized protein n=1 Tax=Vitis vinifera TaxID=29760 RepID=A0A438GM97_VITVI|nr:hypothetical protein CK203_057746 [Vitis vinifera]